MTIHDEILSLAVRVKEEYDRLVSESLDHHRAREYVQADAKGDLAVGVKKAWKALLAAADALCQS